MVLRTHPKLDYATSLALGLALCRCDSTGAATNGETAVVDASDHDAFAGSPESSISDAGRIGSEAAPEASIDGSAGDMDGAAKSSAPWERWCIPNYGLNYFPSHDYSGPSWAANLSDPTVLDSILAQTDVWQIWPGAVPLSKEFFTNLFARLKRFGVKLSAKLGDELSLEDEDDLPALAPVVGHVARRVM
jgi:hypothetical protein